MIKLFNKVRDFGDKMVFIQIVVSDMDGIANVAKVIDEIGRDRIGHEMNVTNGVYTYDLTMAHNCYVIFMKKLQQTGWCLLPHLNNGLIMELIKD